MKCKYCGQNAGFFSRAHEACEQAHSAAYSAVEKSVKSYFLGVTSIQTLVNNVCDGKTNGYLKDEEIATICQPEIVSFTGNIQLPISKVYMQTIDAFLNNIGVPYRILNIESCLDKLAGRLYSGLMVDYFVNGTPLPKIQRRLASVEQLMPISYEQRQEEGYKVLSKAANNFLSNGMLSSQEQHAIEEFSATFSLELNSSNLPASVKGQGADIDRIAQAMVLRTIQQGSLPPSMPISAPILLANNEVVLWNYDGVNMYNEKVEKEYVGRNSGFSFRVMKGVYYRTGGFKGHPIEHRSMNLDGTGSLVITNKHLIFYSPTKTAKIPYKKLVGITPYSDGIEVLKDGNSKRQVFQGFDCWFVMNLLSSINDI